jgi:hypothetical protein
MAQQAGVSSKADVMERLAHLQMESQVLVEEMNETSVLCDKIHNSISALQEECDRLGMSLVNREVFPLYFNLFYANT